MIHFRVRYERLAERFFRLRRRAAFARSIWLGLLVLLAWAALFAITGVRPAAAWLLLVPLVIVAAAAWGARASGINLSRWLDHTFRLDELLVTAVEVDQRGPRSEVEARLLDDAATALAHLGGERRLAPRSTRREIETTLAVALIAAGLLLLGLSHGRLAAVEKLPGLVVAGPGGTGAGSGMGDGPDEGPQHGSGASGEMQALADQLDDLASARAVAAALAAGDPWSAARAARALADQSPDMTDQGRAELADALHAAADAAEGDNRDLAEALRQAGRALESPDPNTSAPGVEQLAGELGSLGGTGAAGGAGQLEPRTESRTGPQAQRLALTPVVATLERSRTGGSVAAGGATSSDADAVSGPDPFVRGGASSSNAGSAGPDALGYPWAMRLALRRYFSRHGSGQ